MYDHICLDKVNTLINLTAVYTNQQTKLRCKDMEHKQDHSADADHCWAEGIFGHLTAKEEDISSTHACVLQNLPSSSNCWCSQTLLQYTRRRQTPKMHATRCVPSYAQAATY